VSVPRVLFIPYRFTDYRIWSDIPDRLKGRAEVIHFDQHGQIPWAEANGGFVAAARRLTADGSFHIVAAAGPAARFGFALAEAGLARGLALFQPELDRWPDDVPLDYSVLGDLDHVLDPYMPLVGAMHEPDPGRRRDIFLSVVRDVLGQDLEPAELELLIAMYSDHVDEHFAEWQALAELNAAQAADAGGPMPPDPPWVQRPWIDRLAELTVPVTTVVGPRGRGIAEAIARRARDAEIIVASANADIGLAPAADRARAAEALLHMLDRTG
jgi:hypothetical protein